MRRFAAARIFAVVLPWIAATAAHGLDPYLVDDINPVPLGASSNPAGFRLLGNAVLFSAADDDNGRELWRTDGTPGGTYRLSDVCPGECGYVTGFVEQLGPRVLFGAWDGDSNGLWVSDGTAAGTTQLVDGVEFYRAAAAPPVAIGNRVFFAGQDAQHGVELWVSDGTAAGTHLVADLVPGANGSNPLWLTAFRGKIFFATTGAVDRALWYSDGTAAGTGALSGPWQAGGLRPSGLGVVGNRLLFTAAAGNLGDELWQTDGTQAGTSPVADLTPGPASSSFALPRVVGGRYYTIVRAGSSRQELWVSDGTRKGTRQLTTLKPQNAFFDTNNAPMALSGPALGSRLVFRANDGKHGVEPWITDGTAKGTRLLKDVCPGTCSGGGEPLLALGNRLLIAGSDSRGKELWITDGTENGTMIVADLCAGACSASPVAHGTLGAKAIVGAREATLGSQLWSTDGSAAGTQRLTDFATTDLSALVPQLVAVVNGAMVLAVYDSQLGWEPWRTDGTAAGTYLVRDLATADSGGSFPSGLRAAGNGIFFFANDGLHGSALWHSDGTGPGTRLVAEHVLPSNLSPASSFNAAAVGATLYFASMAGNGPYGALWKSDGTREGTVPVVDAGFRSFYRGVLAATDTTVFFQGFDAAHGFGLWKSDGTAAGSAPVAPGVIVDPGQLTAVGNRLYFVADGSSADKVALWVTDGSDANTQRLADFDGNLDGLTIGHLTAHAGRLLFVAGTEHDRIQELWTSDGTAAGTQRLATLDGWISEMPHSIVSVGPRAFVFGQSRTLITDGTVVGTQLVAGVVAEDYGLDAIAFKEFAYYALRTPDGFQLWRTDGTTAGTGAVLDADGNPIAAPASFGVLDGRLVFVNYRGPELLLWESDGTAEGTRPLLSRENTASIYPWELVTAGDRLYFPWVDPATGWELWALRP